MERLRSKLPGPKEKHVVGGVKRVVCGHHSETGGHEATAASSVCSLGANTARPALLVLLSQDKGELLFLGALWSRLADVVEGGNEGYGCCPLRSMFSILRLGETDRKLGTLFRTWPFLLVVVIVQLL